jgi:hypothetical protein
VISLPETEKLDAFGAVKVAETSVQVAVASTEVIAVTSANASR